jgi:hypothetical protein
MQPKNQRTSKGTHAVVAEYSKSRLEPARTNEIGEGNLLAGREKNGRVRIASIQRHFEQNWSSNRDCGINE